jgi:hypothetical protein
MSAALKEVEAPVRSDARWKLAEKIADYSEAADKLARLKAAVPISEQRRIDTMLLEERSEALLQEAMSDQRHVYVTALLADQDGGGDVVQQAEARLVAAKAAHQRARETDAALAGEIGFAEQRLIIAREISRRCNRRRGPG